MLKKLDIKLLQDELDLEGKAVLKVIARRLFPCGDSLGEMIVIHFPLPPLRSDTVLTLFTKTLWTMGPPLVSETVISKGPLVVYASKMVPTSDKGVSMLSVLSSLGVFALYSSSAFKVPTISPTKIDDLFIKSIQCTVLMGHSVEIIEDCAAGDTVPSFRSQSRLWTRLACLSASKDSSVCRNQILAFRLGFPVTEEHIVADAGELHSEICMDVGFFEKTTPVFPLKISDLVAPYRETMKAGSGIVALSKTQNKHNLLYIWDVTVPQGRSGLSDSYNAVLQWATTGGICAGENICGVRYNILFLQADAFDHGEGQIIPSVPRACYAASLLTGPVFRILFTLSRSSALKMPSAAFTVA
ncbi:Elongation factor 2 [Hypsizygus marmoreus]|uniref:Elongation factor 2 n=1 Tax=Hypsizygus marmoreus TaxID=39966 RepID=A0A369KCD1_HYPMA|nr:Elongation factor 2 [Hypsizygus marmoreus]